MLSIDVWRHIDDFIRYMGLDPCSSASVSTPLDPNVLFRKADCPAAIDSEIKERVLRAYSKLICKAIWARLDLLHCVSMLRSMCIIPLKKISMRTWHYYLRVTR